MRDKLADAIGIDPILVKALEQQVEAEKSAEPEQEEISQHEVSFDAQQVSELARTSVDFLAGLAMPTTFEHLFPPVHLAAWQLLTQMVTTLIKEPKLALGIPRGFGKTTLIKLFVLYCILFTECKFILIFSDTASKAENILSDIFDMLEELNVKKIFGHWRLGVERDTQSLKSFGFRNRKIIVAALGAGGSVRGLNLKNERPDVMIFDDVQSKECSESQVQSEALERWMIGTAMKAKSPKGCFFIFAGNMYPGPNSILKKLKNNAKWIKFISGAILADGRALWPELRSLESLLEELDNDIAMGHPEIFFSEVLNDTEAGINTKVDLTAIRPWPWGEYEQPQGKCIIIDPSSDKAKSDLVAIGYCEVFDGEVGLREVIEEKLSPGNTIRRALLLAIKTGTRCIIVESNAYQYSLLYWFNEIAIELGLTGFHFVDIYSGSISKNSRIGTMLKSLTQNEMHIHDSVRSKVINQISNWNPLKRDNVDGILDLLTYMARVLEEYGNLMITDTSMQQLDAMSAEATADDVHAF